MNNLIETKIKNFKIRFATIQDIPLIISFIKDLAEYENLLHTVTITEEILKEQIFNKNIAKAIIGEYDGEPVAFALFYNIFSSFLGQTGIFIEDLFVNPNMRNKGLGKIILSFLAQHAIDTGCAKLNWSCGIVE